MLPNQLGFSIIVISVAILVTIFLPPPVISKLKKDFKRQAEPPIIKGMRFLGELPGPELIYIGNTETTWKHGVSLCDSIQQTTGTPGHLLTITNTDMKTLYGILDEHARGVDRFWINAIIQKRSDGREILTMKTAKGDVEEDVTGRGLMMHDTDRKGKKKRGAPRYQDFRKLKGKLFVATRGKRDDELENNEEGPDKLEGRYSIDSKHRQNQMTVMETHFPWVEGWGNDGSHGGNSKGCQLEGCSPRRCRVTTPDCTLRTAPCYLDSPSCHLVDSTNCTAICEECSVTQPDCWMGTSQCVLKKPRSCTVEQIECNVVTPPCTVTRPPCVTKHPPCFVDNQTYTCDLPVTCKGQLEEHGNCTDVPRPCTEKEISTGWTACKTTRCDPALLCLKPAVCHNAAIHCPYPITYCPPEQVHCPAPYVNCSMPKVVCTPPDFDCGFPHVFCEEPQVNCTPAISSCPPVFTKCDHPVVTCPPPDVFCPDPEVVCEEPEPCLIEPVRKCDEPAPCETSNDCECVAIMKRNKPDDKGNHFEERGGFCDELFKPLCATGGL